MGLKSEYVIIDLVQRIVRLPGLRVDASGIHQITITLSGEEVSCWCKLICALCLHQLTQFFKI